MDGDRMSALAKPRPPSPRPPSPRPPLPAVEQGAMPTSAWAWWRSEDMPTPTWAWHPALLDASLGRARQRLLSLQHPDGHWCGELQGDTILESEYILLMAFLGREQDEKVRKA